MNEPSSGDRLAEVVNLDRTVGATAMADRHYAAIVAMTATLLGGLRSDLAKVPGSADLHPLVRIHGVAKLLRANGARVDLLAAHLLLLMVDQREDSAFAGAAPPG